MKKRLISVLMVILMALGIIAGCTANAAEGVFSTPENGKQIE